MPRYRAPSLDIAATDDDDDADELVTDESLEPVSQDDARDELSRLAAALAAAGADRSKRRKAVSDLESFIVTLNPRDYPDLIESDVVRSFIEDMGARAVKKINRPGMIVNSGTVAQTKKPWSFGDLKSPPDGWRKGQPLPDGHCEWVFDYIPNITRTVTLQGLTVRFIADTPWTGPKPFVDILTEGRRLERVGHEHASYMFKTGGMPSDPTVISEATRRVRATSTNIPGMAPGFMPGSGVGPRFFEGQEQDAEATEAAG